MNKKTNKYLCIHGHFYQPPRENPWTNTIHIQKSAYPYHDWNERITRECYAPNTRSRLHGENGYISKLLNNYELISFNFGPTLLSWLEKNNPWVYSQIIDADTLSMDRFNGHGNAIAQVYNHIIMPLASERDKITQVKWGIADFYHRFRRKPEGMWLSEAAVDSKTLMILANEGIKFTILSPYQAHMIRSLRPDHDGLSWRDVSGGNIDCTRPYRCFPTDKKNLYIDIFFYNSPLSKAIAYEKILASGEVFLKRIMDSYPPVLNTPALVNIATDGESYGHHYKFGEMALTWVLEMVNNGQDIELTNYSAFLEKFPPENEIKIIENSSWSCAHGIERWRSNCGCSVSQNARWTQSWRTPLRNGLDWLNGHLLSIFEEKTKGLLKNYRETRDDYISLLLKPDEREKKTFILNHAARPLNTEEIRLIFQLLESQKMALYMFTSCGWFFDDISGLEVIQILMYAKKAIELCKDFSDEDLEKGLTGFLSEAVCNNPDYKNGMDIYIKKVIPLSFDVFSILANYAVVCCIDSKKVPDWLKILINLRKEEKYITEDTTIYLCEILSKNQSKGKSGLVAVVFKSRNNELACVTGEPNEQSYDTLLNELKNALPLKYETYSILDLVKKYLKNARFFSLKELIPDIKNLVVKSLSDEIESRLFNSFFDDTGSIKNYLKAISMAEQDIPSQFSSLLKTVFLELLFKLFKKSENLPIDFSEVEDFLESFRQKTDEITNENPNILIRENLIKQQRLTFLFEGYLAAQIEKIHGININIHFINIIKSINFINKYKMPIDWWKCQNIFYDLKTKRDFLINLDHASLDLFRQAERLLGFTGGS